MKHIFVFLFLSIILYFPAVSQDTPDPPESIPSDNLAVDPASKFSLVFTRGFMLTGSQLDTVPITGSNSGTFSIGGGIKIPLIKNSLGLRLTPSIAWTHINYNQTSIKTFPTIPDSINKDLTVERHRLTFVEMPLGFYLNLSKDEDGDPKFFLEAGGYVGYLIGGYYKIKYNNNLGREVKEVTRNQEKDESETITSDFERLRYGIYGRFGYKWAAIYYAVRLTDVFDEFTNESQLPKNVQGFKNPIIPPMELGITIFL